MSNDLDRARAVYKATREARFAPGLIDAHERLAIATVAAGLRPFAFLNHLMPKRRGIVADLLNGAGLYARIVSPRFDYEIVRSRVSKETVAAYKACQVARRFWGVGVWSHRPELLNLTTRNLGAALSYPQCCAAMDVRTKQSDHKHFLWALVAGVGDNPEEVRAAIRKKLGVEKNFERQLQGWYRRQELTFARFPFALHAACTRCLQSPSSPTSMLNSTYRELAREISDELHFLVQWAAETAARGRR